MKEAKGKKKKPIKWGGIVFYACCLLAGGLTGGLMGRLSKQASQSTGVAEEGFSFDMLYLGGGLLFLCMALFVHIIIHEGGHLVFGLLSGYKFQSFRIGSLVWVKYDDGVKLKRFSLAGTGGQCLMEPPPLKDGTVPVMLYNFGGAVMNFIWAAAALVIALLPGVNSWISAGLMVFAAAGCGAGLLNAIPINTGVIINDGGNALAVKKNAEAMRAWHGTLAANALLSKGKRVRELSEDLFFMPTEEGLSNAIAATSAVNRVSWLIDRGMYVEALTLLEKLDCDDYAIIGIHRTLMLAQEKILRLLGFAVEGEEEESKAARLKILSERLTEKAHRNILKAMKTYPAVLTYKYAAALLDEGDEGEAQKVLAAFEKMAKSYPYSGDVEGEREIQELVRKCFDKKKEAAA